MAQHSLTLVHTHRAVENRRPALVPRATEHGALLTRICILEAALACIERETALAVLDPVRASTAVVRIDAIARQALASDHAPRADGPDTDEPST